MGLNESLENGLKFMSVDQNGGLRGIDDYEELPIYANEWSNLCTNMWELPYEMAAIVTGLADGVFDRAATAIDDTTEAGALPENVVNIMVFVTEEDFNGLTANQKLVDGTDADGAACEACVPFFTWWDFLSAAA